MNLITVLERLAYEYKWAPRDLRRLTIAQIRAFWEAMAARMAEAAGNQRPTARARTSTTGSQGASMGYAQRPGMTKTQRADGKTETTYNLLSLIAQSRGGGAPPSPNSGRGQGSWHSGTP